MLSSARLGLPLLSVGQAQKEIIHNEALIALDCLVQATFVGVPSNDPPSEPVVGQSYLCGGSPQGEWADQANAIALWTLSGWRFAPAFEGMTLRKVPEGAAWQFLNGKWLAGTLICNEIQVDGRRVVGPQVGPLSEVIGGTVIDVEARRGISEMLAALQQHGLVARS